MIFLNLCSFIEAATSGDLSESRDRETTSNSGVSFLIARGFCLDTIDTWKIYRANAKCNFTKRLRGYALSLSLMLTREPIESTDARGESHARAYVNYTREITVSLLAR
jgi:hypothetical protein